MQNSTKETVENIKDYLDSIPKEVVTKHKIIREVVTKQTGFFGRLLGRMQFGGYIPVTGAYLLHRGEFVIPRGGAPISVSVAPVYNISGVGIDEIRLRNILEEHDRKLLEEIERIKIPGV